jgi:hypothetical protein
VLDQLIRERGDDLVRVDTRFCNDPTRHRNIYDCGIDPTNGVFRVFKAVPA